MKLLPVLVVILLAGPAVCGQEPLSAAHECSKSISFSVAEGGQPVPAIPKFVVKWINDNKHQKDYSGLCFSQAPDARTKNFVVVFSTLTSSFDGLTPTAHTYTRTPPVSDNQAVVSSYGGTWDYSYIGPMNTTPTATINLQYADKYKALFVQAYNQQGGLVSRYSPDRTRSREAMLERAIADIRNYNQPVPQQRPVATPLSVYYVNCDVDGAAPSQTLTTASLAPGQPEPAPKQAAQEATLQFWSSPLGADIYLDGTYIGKTPYSLIIPAGEHTIAMRKKDFGTWQRKSQITPGERRVAAYLEQKAVTVGFGVQ